MKPFSTLVDKHKGECALVCGTGTSLLQFPVEFYKEFKGFTVGVNTILGLFVPDYYLSIYAQNNVINCSLDKEQYEFHWSRPFPALDVKKRGMISLSNTTALSALTAAYQLGATKIYLIGIDYLTGKDNQVYYNGGTVNGKHVEIPDTHEYAKGRVKRDESHYLPGINEKKRETDIEIFAKIASEMEREGVKVYNLSQNSALRGIEVVQW